MKEVINVQNVMTVKDAMQYLKSSSYNTFKRNYLDQGLPVILVGKNRRIERNDLDMFLNRHKIIRSGEK